MIVSVIMTHKPVTIHPQNALRVALETMHIMNCRHLPVISSEGHLVGIVSDRDCRTALHSPFLIHAAWQNKSLPDDLLIRTVMTPAPIVTEPNAFVSEAVRLMLTNHINCLPVMLAETLVGILTTSDILISFVKTKSYA